VVLQCKVLILSKVCSSITWSVEGGSQKVDFCSFVEGLINVPIKEGGGRIWRGPKFAHAILEQSLKPGPTIAQNSLTRTALWLLNMDHDVDVELGLKAAHNLLNYFLTYASAARFLCSFGVKIRMLWRKRYLSFSSKVALLCNPN